MALVHYFVRPAGYFKDTVCHAMKMRERERESGCEIFLVRVLFYIDMLEGL